MSEKYPLSLRVLHWLIALLILALLALGFTMTWLKHSPYHAPLYALHKSLGVSVLTLAALRLLLKLTLRMPAFPSVIPESERLLAHFGHALLYLFMFAMPLSGMVMSMSYGLPVKWFGLALPSLVNIDKARGALAARFHYVAAFALLAMIAMHAGAVALHYWKHRVNLLKRML